MRTMRSIFSTHCNVLLLKEALPGVLLHSPGFVCPHHFIFHWDHHYLISTDMSLSIRNWGLWDFWKQSLGHKIVSKHHYHNIYQFGFWVVFFFLVFTNLFSSWDMLVLLLMTSHCLCPPHTINTIFVSAWRGPRAPSQMIIKHHGEEMCNCSGLYANSSSLAASRRWNNNKLNFKVNWDVFCFLMEDLSEWPI